MTNVFPLGIVSIASLAILVDAASATPVLKNPISPNDLSKSVVTGVFYESRKNCPGVIDVLHTGTDIAPVPPAAGKDIHACAAGQVLDVNISSNPHASFMTIYTDAAGSDPAFTTRYYELPGAANQILVGNLEDVVQGQPIAKTSAVGHVHIEVNKDAGGITDLTGLVNPQQYGLQTNADTQSPVFQSVISPGVSCGYTYRARTLIADVSPNNPDGFGFGAVMGVNRVILTYNGWTGTSTDSRGPFNSYEAVSGSNMAQKWSLIYEDTGICGTGKYWLAYFVPECYQEEEYSLQFEAFDNNGNRRVYSSSLVGIDRNIINMTATGENEQVELGWDAVGFDQGITFAVQRSHDGGISFPEAIGQVQYDTSTLHYTFTDTNPAYAHRYFYRLVDSESSTAWKSVSATPFGLPDPPAPTGVPAVTITKVFADSVWMEVTAGVEWASEYLINHGPGPFGMVHSDVKDAFPCTIEAEANPGTVYGVFATARTGSGDGPHSYYSLGRLLGSVGSAEVVAGNGELGTFWTAVSGASRYLLEWVDQETQVRGTRVVHGLLGAVVTGLDVDHAYCMFVRGGDEYGHFGPSMLGTACATPNQTVGVPESPVAPSHLRVWPNPFRASTQIEWTGQVGDAPEAHVFDLQGRVVRALTVRPSGSGVFATDWDGKAEGGGALASGMYVVSVTVGEKRTRQKALLLK